MHNYEVGKPYSATRKVWPEAVDYNYRGGEHELRLFWTQPSVGEVYEVSKSRADFAMLVDEGVIFMLYKFGTMQWSDAPFTIHLVPEEERVIPGPKHGQHALLQVVLVDAATGIIKTLRAVTFSPEFTTALEGAIREQAKRPWDQAAHDMAIQRAYAKYPQSKDMARAATTRTAGGD